MSVPEFGDILRFQAYGVESDSATVAISWSQSLKNKTATYYIVKAKNISKGDADVLVYIEDRFYRTESDPDYIGKIPGAQEEGNEWVVAISERFQYAERNAQGENRWLVLHDTSYKVYEHRFMIATMQGNAPEWAKKLAGSHGAGDVSEQVQNFGASFRGGFFSQFFHGTKKN